MLTVMRMGSVLAVTACTIFGQAGVGVAQSGDAESEIWPPVPSFMFEGLRGGEILRFPSPVPLVAGWQNVVSDRGMVDVQHIPQPYRAMRFHVLRNDPRNNPRIDFRLACLVQGIGEQSSDGGYCPNEDQFPRSKFVTAFRLELYGSDADQFGLSYRCWSARKGDGADLVDHGDKSSGQWCGSQEPDLWITRIVVRVEKLGP